MSEEMEILLNSLVKAAKAQVRQLNLQIEDYEELLGTEEQQRVMAQSTYENAPDNWK